MKCIIIGLGNFGSSLGQRLVSDGHEVIGVDKNKDLTDLLHEHLSHTISLDTTDRISMKQLPLKDADIIVNSIGEDLGASVTTTALLKEYSSEVQLICRASTDVHETILQAIGVDEIIHPEAEFAHQMANRLTIGGSLKTLVLDSSYEIMEVELPSGLKDKKVKETDLREEYDISIVTVLQQKERRSLLGIKRPYEEVVGVIGPHYTFQENDTLVLFGKAANIREMVNAYSP